MQKSKGKSAERSTSFSFATCRENRKTSICGRNRPLLTFDFPALSFALSFAVLISLVANCSAQTLPYAAINRDAVNYNGPGRDAAHDLAGQEIRIGLVVPLTGSRQTEGKALQHAAQLAVDDENAASLPTHKLALVVRDESGPWGQVSNQIVNLVFDDRAVAVITSDEGASAHLAEQVGNKIGVPILTLSSDSTTTEINLPWIFRLGPTDATQAQAFARGIYQNRKLRSVVLLSQSDRDGVLGSRAFIKAASELNAPAPTQIRLDAGEPALGLDAQLFANTDAAVIWADAPTARAVAARVYELRPSIPIYLCRKAAGGDSERYRQTPCPDCGAKDNATWIATTPGSSQAYDAFRRRYHEGFGVEPSADAAQAYDAVHILAVSLRQSGANRARLRDALAAVSKFPGASGIISFDHAGNDTSTVTLLKLK